MAETAADAWMLSRLAKQVRAVTDGIESYAFGETVRGVQAFFWNEVCDWYVEVTKARLKDEGSRLQAQRNLIYVLDTSLRLMHPFMPFVTEAIWDQMPVSVLDLDEAGESRRADALMVAAWPEPDAYAHWIDEPAERAFELTRAVVTDVRSTRARYRLSPKEQLRVVVRAHAAETVDAMAPMAALTPMACSKRWSSVVVVASSWRAVSMVSPGMMMTSFSVIFPHYNAPGGELPEAAGKKIPARA